MVPAITEFRFQRKKTNTDLIFYEHCLKKKKKETSFVELLFTSPILLNNN